MRSARASVLLLATLVASCDRTPPPPAAQASANSLRIVANDFSYVSPDTVPAGLTNIVMVNHGKEPHQAAIFRMDSVKTTAEIQAGLMSNTIPSWVIITGGPNGADPGDSSNVAAVLKAGNYMMVCFMSGADGKPHLMKGMTKPFVVKPAGAAMALPNADVTVTTKDYSFEVSPAITAGTHTIRLVNAGPQLHEITLVKMARGKTMKDAQTWMAAGMKGMPPFTSFGGIAGLAMGQAANFTATFTPGDYVMLCFVPDTKDGKAHLEHGMVLPFKVS
ncbi:MAG TPA: hypothetical protein VH113_06980 [Gemmatimonadales bacterium]|jgi:hypothetical protein|nr:hypothetical protein [Gemmatimonadales bacterium]